MTTMLYIGFELMMIAVITVMAAILPAITKPGLAFGVEIPKEFDKHEELAKMKRIYQQLCIGGGAVLAAITLILHMSVSPIVADIMLPFAMIAYLIFTTLCYYSAHNKLLRLKKQMGWDKIISGRVVTDTASASLRLPSAWWFLAHVILIAATAGVLWMMYPSMPEMLPMHMDITGNVNRYAEKSLKTVLLPLLTQVYITVICALAFISIKRAKRQIDPKDAVASSKRNTIFKTIWLYYILLLSLLINILMIIIAQVMFITPQLMYAMPYVLISFVAIILGGTIIIAVKTGQGGSRIKIDGKTADGMIQTGSDQYWKAGMFYYNPDDPSIFVEKRFGVGWTFNFARPASWWFMALIIGFIIAFSVGITFIAK